METYYDILGLDTSCSQAEIKRAFRTKAKELHPDVAPPVGSSADRMRLLIQAYKTLADPELRKHYDRTHFIIPAKYRFDYRALLSPQQPSADGQDASVPAGTVTLTGRVTDAVGIASLSYETGAGQTGELDLTPGDPYWTVEVDVSGAGRRGSIAVTATDVAGNGTTLERTFQVDDNADLPRIASHRIVGDHLVGTATDDDGIAAVEYRIAGGEWQRRSAERSFAVALPGPPPAGTLPPGEYTVSVRAVDVNERTGPSVESSYTVSQARPLFTELQVAETEEEPAAQFGPGLILDQGGERLLVGTVQDAWGVNEIRYRFDDAEEWSTTRLQVNGEEGTGSFELSIGRRQEPGRHELTLEVENADGDGDRIDTFYYVLQELPEEPDPEVEYLTEIPDAPGLYLPEGRLDSASDLVHFRNRRAMTAFVVGASAQEARLEPETTAFAVSVDDRVVRVEPTAPARTENVTLVVTTTDGEELRSDALDLLYDPAAPELEVRSPESDSWHARPVEVSVSATDSVGDPTVAYAVDDGELNTVQPGENGYTFTVEPPEEDATVVVRIRAEDGAQNATEVVRTLNFDNTAPQISVVTPAQDDQVNGTITVAGTVRDAAPVSALRWSPDGETFEPLPPGGAFSFAIDLTRYGEADTRPVMEAVDAAGNERRLEMSFPIAVEADKPRVSVQLPPDDSVQREDFTVSGTVFDDDGVAEIMARVDDGEFRSIGSGDSFSIPISIGELGDNEHTVTVKAVDLGGVESDEESVTFSISLESPVGTVESPRLAAFVRDEVAIRGTASDANGIESVRLSFDNGSTFMDVASESEAPYEEWSYPLKTAVLRDGLHAVQVELTDGLGTEALFSSLLTVDNTPPDIQLDLPADGATFLETVRLSGKVTDAQRLADVRAVITPLETADAAEASTAPPDNDDDATAPVVRTIDLIAGGIVQQSLDLSELPQGRYNVSLVAVDESENVATVSRNVSLLTSVEERERVELYAPFEGSAVSGSISVEGRVFSPRQVERVTVRLDGEAVGIATVGNNGFFSYLLDEDSLTDGAHTVAAEVIRNDESAAQSLTSSFTFQALGPWVEVQSHAIGETVGSRPIIAGTAGYRFEEPEDLEPGSREYRQAVRPYQVSRVDVSLDNGATYDRAGGADTWEYRIETGELEDGWQPVLVRMTANNGRRAYRRMLLRIDTVPPSIDLDFPRESARFNDVVAAGGTAHDSNELDRVEMILREGNRNRYEVPEFIQGMYADIHVLGASTWDAGLGLTFFDQNVKLQAQIGVAPPGRFSGLVMGGKLLANVARLPFSVLFGPSLDFLSASLAVGANFSYFTMSEDRIAFTDEGLVLGGIVGQVEFPIISVDDWRLFNAYSLYTEGQLWFISSDIQGGIQTKISFGLRVQLL